ncbi:MAG TPA: lipid-A-disaccharide synthase [Steroidobacteraceae bacterium]|nr:lipid-A-disaccharide synthase [Steroidobacteraceae bacterium]
MRFALVAGEASGDQLGAALMRSLRERDPSARFFGVAGPKMQSEGCEAWALSEELAVMGLFEVLSHLPRLARLRADLRKRLRTERPDVFIGIDAPEFNLGLARDLRGAGLRTVQYVSPQVWAWRQGRVRSIGAAVDLVLCLLPFEEQFYARAGIRAEFVGHPLADLIPEDSDRGAARRQLGLQDRLTVAVLPGSRVGEASHLGDDFAGAIRWLRERRPSLQFVAPMANQAVRLIFSRALERNAAGVEVRLLDGQSHVALAAADVVLVASGTATLETLLTRRPMVVAYRLGALTAWLLRTFNLMKAPYFSQPNLLAGKRIVPELFQEQVTPETLGTELLRELDDPAVRERQERVFGDIHRRLKRNASDRAAQAILGLLSSAPAAGST